MSQNAANLDAKQMSDPRPSVAAKPQDNDESIRALKAHILCTRKQMCDERNVWRKKMYESATRNEKSRWENQAHCIALMPRWRQSEALYFLSKITNSTYMPTHAEEKLAWEHYMQWVRNHELELYPKVYESISKSGEWQAYGLPAEKFIRAWAPWRQKEALALLTTIRCRSDYDHIWQNYVKFVVNPENSTTAYRLRVQNGLNFVYEPIWNDVEMQARHIPTLWADYEGGYFTEEDEEIIEQEKRRLRRATKQIFTTMYRRQWPKQCDYFNALENEEKWRLKTEDKFRKKFELPAVDEKLRARRKTIYKLKNKYFDNEEAFVAARHAV